MNSINLVGRLTADPELRYTQNGTAVCSFTLAVDRPRVKDTTDFISCVAWRQPGEYLCKYGRKGSMTAVSGCLTSRRYEDKNGAKRVAFEVLCDALSLCEGRNSAQGASTPAQSTNAAQTSSTPPAFEDLDDDSDLPF